MPPAVKLPTRTNGLDGFVLNKHGATIADAIESSDIAIPAYRQRLRRDGFKQLTSDNGNDTASGFKGLPPSIETCQKIINEVAKRREPKILALREELAEAKEELKADLTRGDKGYWRTRKKSLEEAIIKITKDVEITADELHRAFVREDVAERGRNLSPEIRAAVEQMQYEQQAAEYLGDDGMSDLDAPDEWGGTE